jgi:hypothetical protein
MDGMRMAQNVFPIQHAAQVFSMAHSCYNPSILAQTLHKSNHFRILGTFKRGIKVGPSQKLMMASLRLAHPCHSPTGYEFSNLNAAVNAG